MHIMNDFYIFQKRIQMFTKLKFLTNVARFKMKMKRWTRLNLFFLNLSNPES